MNWDALSAIAEMIAAAGVIISIIYLAMQIRQNTEAMRHTLRQQTLAHESVSIATLTPLFISAAEDADLAQILTSARGGLDGMDPVSQARFATYARAVTTAYFSGHKNYLAGVADPDLWENQRRAMVLFASSAGWRDWWEQQGSALFAQIFQDHIVELTAPPGEPAAAGVDTVGRVHD